MGKFPPVIDGYLFKNQEEVDAVVALHSALKDLHGDCLWASLNVHDTRTLLCFARARRLDVVKAESMWRSSYHWRKENDPELALKGYMLPSVLDAYGCVVEISQGIVLSAHIFPCCCRIAMHCWTIVVTAFSWKGG